MSDEPLIQADNLSFSYGKSSIINNFSFTLKKAEILAILGLSGSGKTTLLKLVCGLENPKQGSISIGDKTLFERKKSKSFLRSSAITNVPPSKRKMTMVFQDDALFPHLNVFKNISFALKSNDTNKKRKTEDILKLLNLCRFSKRYPDELSGGQRQRVGLARALVSHPKAILMDEPFSSLDRPQRESVCDSSMLLLKNIGAATILVTHDAQEALKHADRVIVIDQGKIIQEGTPENLCKQPNSVLVASLLGEINHKKFAVINNFIKTPFGKHKVPDHLSDEKEVEAIIDVKSFKIGKVTALSNLIIGKHNKSKAIAKISSIKNTGFDHLIYMDLPIDKDELWKIYARIPEKSGYRAGQWVELDLKKLDMLRIVKIQQQ